MKYFDSHAHYYDERFESEINESVDSLIGALLQDSVSYIVNIGTSPAASRLAIEQAKKFDNMYTAVGIHPSDTRFLTDIDSELREIEELIGKKVCLVTNLKPCKLCGVDSYGMILASGEEDVKVVFLDPSAKNGDRIH